MEYKNFIETALMQSTEIAKEKFGKVGNSTKPTDNNQVLTEADLLIGSHIIKLIEETYPNHNIIDEEAGVINKNSEFTWVIDPIDGTSNFAAASPLFGIFLGLLKDNQPYAGGAALPYFNEIYSAQKGNGAWCNGKEMKVSKEDRLLSSLVVYSLNGYQNQPEKTHWECALLEQIVLNIRNLRATGGAFDPAMVIKGTYGAGMHLGTSIWDVAAIHCIIEEAGGTVTDFFGTPFDYSDHLSNYKKPYPICAGAPQIHKQLQTIISNYLKEHPYNF